MVLIRIISEQHDTTDKHIEREYEPCAVSSYEVKDVAHCQPDIT